MCEKQHIRIMWSRGTYEDWQGLDRSKEGTQESLTVVKKTCDYNKMFISGLRNVIFTRDWEYEHERLDESTRNCLSISRLSVDGSETHLAVLNVLLTQVFDVSNHHWLIDPVDGFSFGKSRLMEALPDPTKVCFLDSEPNFYKFVVLLLMTLY